MMTNEYNLYNYEALFKKYLLAENVSTPTLKNYLSDFRHFSGWFAFYIKNHISHPSVSVTLDAFPLISTYLTIEVVSDYKLYLIENSLPLRTINRRLSAIRKFCSFCISQGWLKQNPAKKVTNIINTNNEITLPESSYDGILKQFQSHLMSMNIDHITITNYLNDVRELLIIS